jgi:hypothetical protein
MITLDAEHYAGYVVVFLFFHAYCPFHAYGPLFQL